MQTWLLCQRPSYCMAQPGNQSAQRAFLSLFEEPQNSPLCAYRLAAPRKLAGFSIRQISGRKMAAAKKKVALATDELVPI